MGVLCLSAMRLGGPRIRQGGNLSPATKSVERRPSRNASKDIFEDSRPASVRRTEALEGQFQRWFLVDIWRLWHNGKPSNFTPTYANKTS